MTEKLSWHGLRKPAAAFASGSLLPGVTDNIGHTASELLNLTLGGHQPVYSSQTLLIDGNVTESNVKAFAAALHNPLIQRARVEAAWGAAWNG